MLNKLENLFFLEFLDCISEIETNYGDGEGYDEGITENSCNYGNELALNSHGDHIPVSYTRHRN